MQPKLTKQDYNYLYDGIYGLFGIQPTDAQIRKLLKLCPTWDGCVDTMSRDIILESIAKYFIGMSVPKYMNTRHYYQSFYRRVEDNRDKIMEFLNAE